VSHVAGAVSKADTLCAPKREKASEVLISQLWLASCSS
jgi:hypothetical protein